MSPRVSESIGENKIVLESTIKKGILTKISYIINTSRQNIDKLIKSADIAGDTRGRYYCVINISVVTLQYA